MKAWALILLGLGLCWYATDVRSTSTLQNTLIPLLGVLFLFAAVIKLITAIKTLGGRSGSGAGASFIDASGDDWGGGGDGGGDG